MSWRTLMKAEKKAAPTFSGPQYISTKSTKPPGLNPDHSHQDNFVDIVDENREPECSHSTTLEPANLVEPSNARLAFDLNAGINPAAPPIRSTTLEVGATVTVNSPMFGTFESTVLKDNGVIVWVWHPFIEREVAVPNEWLA